MLNEESKTAEEETDSTEEQGERRKVSALDPDFLLFALPLALIIDIVNIALFFLAGVAGTVLDLIAGWTLIPWLIWRTGKGSARKKVLRRGILMFIFELIPGVDLVPWWTIQVLLTLSRKAAAQQNPVPSAPKNATIPQQA